MKQKAIIIFTANTARRLLQEGFTMIDIKPDKTDPDGKRSVFVFEYKEEILNEIKKQTIK